MNAVPHALDRPVWATLVSQPELAEGGELAKRCRRDVNLFASARDDGDASQAALSALLQPGDTVYVLQVPRILLPPTLTLVRAARGVQMVALRAMQAADVDGPEQVIPLGDADAPDMLALAQQTQPGPFLERTHTMGEFVGVRLDGRLVAMAGERMRLPGHVEVSGVCTHPDYRGRGLARRLSAIVAQRIQQRGEQPFLHAWASNGGAIRLYEGLGFSLRTEVNVSVLLKAG
jgi:predicted GNAT family acetyltransferase